MSGAVFDGAALRESYALNCSANPDSLVRSVYDLVEGSGRYFCGVRPTFIGAGSRIYFFMGEIKFELKKPSAVKVLIKTLQDRVIEIFDYKDMSVGEHSVYWQPKSAALGNVFKFYIEAGGKFLKDGIFTTHGVSAEKN